MNIFVIVAALLILLILTLKKVPIAVSALLSVVFMAACSRMPVFETIAKDYMGGVADFVRSTWLMILLGTILSRLMDRSGAAASVARFTVKKLGVKWAIPAIVVTGGILTYGGISGFAACYALYPITLIVFREAGLPKYFMPAVISAGVHTWANMLPGNPSMVNIVPTVYLGTTVMAAPGIGIFGVVSTLALSLLYLEFEVRKAVKRGDRFAAEGTREKGMKNPDAGDAEGSLPNPLLVLLPIICVAVVMNVLKQDVAVALFAGIVICGLLFRKNITEGREILEGAASEAAVTLMTAASVVGIGSVIKVTPGFLRITELILAFGEAGRNPLVLFVIAVALMSGMNASAMGGLSAILSALAEHFLQMGVSAEVLHRVGIIAAIGPGGLPHSGGMVGVLEICGVSYKEGYRHLFAVVVAIPLITLLLVLACATNIGM